MIFKHYCAVFFNPTTGLDLEVSKVSESKLRVIPGKNISIFTFTSLIEVAILSDYFKSFNRNFLLFELNDEVSAFNFNNKKKEEDLFGFLNNENINKNFESLSNMLLDDFIKQTLDTESEQTNTSFSGNQIFNIFKNSEDDNRIFDINEKMTSREINDEIDKIIDKGVKNLTDNDKKLLEKLSNLR